MEEQSLLSTTTPLVSICIPVFNCRQFIHRALESCINQSYKNIEIIVVDNASTEEMEEVVLKYVAIDKRIKYFKNRANVGIMPCIFQTFEYATGSFVQHLACDDWLSFNYVEETVNQFKLQPDAAAVAHPMIGLSVGNGKFHFDNLITFPAKNYSIDYIAKNIFKSQWGTISFFCLMRRQDVIRTIPFIQQTYQDSHHGWLYRQAYAVDWLTFLKVVSGYRYFVFTDKVVYLKLEHSKNASKDFGLEFTQPSKVLNFYDIVRRSLDYIYKTDFKKYFNEMRIFIGVEAINSLILQIIKLKFKWSFISRFRYKDIRLFFADYSFLQKLGVILYLLPFLFLRIFKFIFRKFLSKPVRILPTKNYFLDDEMSFTVSSSVATQSECNSETNMDYESK